MADLSEFWKGLVAAWAADAGLIALLGETAGSPSLMLEFPAIRAGFPLLTIDTGSVRPAAAISGIGLYRPEFQVNIFAVSQHACIAIDGYLEAHWTIPLTRSAALSTDHYEATLLRRRDATLIGPVRALDTDERVYHLACEWTARINQTA